MTLIERLESLTFQYVHKHPPRHATNSWKKPLSPEKGFFRPQFEQLMVGAHIMKGAAGGKKVRDIYDVCRYAAGECDLTCIDIHVESLDAKRLLTDDEFFEETVVDYKACGIDIRRISSHFSGQVAGGIHSAYLSRFGGKIALKNGWMSKRKQFEKQAMERVQMGLLLGKKLGATHHQTFMGGRGTPHQDQWTTLPEDFLEYSHLQVALKWGPTLKMAERHGQVIGFEIGHVMEIGQTVSDLVLFRTYVEKLFGKGAAAAAKWGVDTSHFDKEGDDGALEVKCAIPADIDSPGHAKDARCEAPTKGRHRQNAVPFADQAGKFGTFGTLSAASAHAFAQVLLRGHERHPAGTQAIIEGEDVYGILNPFQAMKAASRNLDLVLGGADPISFEHIKLEKWDGPTFETFAKTDLLPGPLLELDAAENRALMEAAEQVGLARKNLPRKK